MLHHEQRTRSDPGWDSECTTTRQSFDHAWGLTDRIATLRRPIRARERPWDEVAGVNHFLTSGDAGRRLAAAMMTGSMPQFVRSAGSHFWRPRLRLRDF